MTLALQKQRRTEQILIKLIKIIKDDPKSIIENKDIFTQILAAVDKQTIDQLFASERNIEASEVVWECQQSIFKMVITHYLLCNPILGTFERKLESF